MDTCFAGSLYASPQNDLGRAYEVLGACHKNRTTASPGPHSFTHILHKSFESLVSKREIFTTVDLYSAVRDDEARRNNPPEFWSRSANTARHITLAPLQSQSASQPADYFVDQPITHYINLRVELTDPHKPSLQEIKELARNVSKAVRGSSIKTRRIDCMGLIPRPSRTIRAAARIFSSLKRWRCSCKAPSNPVANLAADVKLLNGNRKRTPNDDGSDLEDEPEPKRRASDTLKVFDSSRPKTPNRSAEG